MRQSRRSKSALTSAVKVRHISRDLQAHRWILETLQRHSILHWDTQVIGKIRRLINREWQIVQALELAEFNHKRARGKLLTKLVKDQRDDSRNRGKVRFALD